MKNALKLACMFSILGSCVTRPVYEARVLHTAPALREVFRGGTIQGLEDNTGHYIGAPDAYNLVEHTCTSRPIFDLAGRYVKTSVKCW